VTYLAPFILLAPLVLLLVGEKVSARIRDRRKSDPLAWIDERIRTRPDQRSAWRMVKKTMQEDL
jgi:hypothetical protein